MENQIAYQNNIRLGDPQRNKFAVSSFVLSLISLIISPLVIPQILGVIFGILGLKSEKKGLSIAGLVISIIAVVFGIILLLAIISVGIFGNVLSNAKLKADQDMTVKIQSAIVRYIEDTGDVDLKFGENETPTVEKVLSKLQGEVILDGNSYGPYLSPISENNTELKPNSIRYKGWDIKINKDAATIEVKLSETGHSLVID